MTTPDHSLNAIHAAADADLQSLIAGKQRIVTAQGVEWPLGAGQWLRNWAGDRIGYVVSIERMRFATPSLRVRARLLDGWLYRGRHTKGHTLLVLMRESA